MCTSGYISVRTGERAGASVQKCAGAEVLHAYVCVRVGSCICECMCKHVQTRVGVCEGMHAGVRVCIGVCANMRWRVRGMHAGVRVCMGVCMQVCVDVCGGAYMRAHLRLRGRMSACAGERASDNFIHKINYIYVF